MAILSHTSKLAVPAVVLLISFLSFSSQWLFNRIDPEPLSTRQSVWFNAEITAMLICYIRCCLTDPGYVPANWQSLVRSTSSKEVKGDNTPQKRWCKKCEAPKPPRAHHCKVCKRCIAKMDHHCPWTTRCVGHRLIPHFVRFVFYAVVAMAHLERFLYLRLATLWEQRRYPVSYGPSPVQLVHLLLLCVVNSLTLFLLAILLARTAWSIAANATTIESWEMERHEAVLRRAKRNGGFLAVPGGGDMRIERHEFPYDVGIWKNITQSMGTANIVSWLWPLSSSPAIEAGLWFEVNDFNEPHLSWPPPEPERVAVPRRAIEGTTTAFTTGSANFSSEEVAAFRERQRRDLQRRGIASRLVSAGEKPASDAKSCPDNMSSNGSAWRMHEFSQDRQRAWRNAEDEGLEDYGVDEDA